MPPLAATTMLTAWEHALPAGGNRRAPAMLETLDPPGDPADLPLGQRDALLLRLYQDLRGPDLDALAMCPRCAVTLEVRLPVADLTAGYPTGEAAGGAAAWNAVDLPGITVEIRSPSTADLLAIAGEPDLAAARSKLIHRCVRSATVGSPDMLGGDRLGLLGDELERLDPLVDARIEIRCAECGEAWSALVDIPLLVWAGLHGAARRLLREVDTLARRYGWAESDILRMSEQRRQAYLDLG